jgi:hypothetical protein
MMPNDDKHEQLLLSFKVKNFGQLHIDESDPSTLLGRGGFGSVHKTEGIINGVSQTVRFALKLYIMLPTCNSGPLKYSLHV